MKYGLSLITPPTAYPVSLAEAKKQCEDPAAIPYNDEQIKTDLIPTATAMVESRTGRQLLNATWDYKLDRFPCGSEGIYIPLSPLASVTSITYTDAAGASQTLATSVYKVIPSREPGQIVLKYGQAWPVVYSEPDVVAVRFVAGYGATDTAVADTTGNYMKAKRAILMLIGHWFANREAVGNVGKEIELGFGDLCNSCSVGDEFHCYG